jgi:hypothetical protein
LKKPDRSISAYKPVCFALVDPVDCLEPADAEQPFHRQIHEVDGEHGRRVVERLLLHVRAVLQHDRQIGVGAALGGLLHKIVTDDDECYAGRSEVLLRAGVDHAVFGDVDWAAEHVRRGVGHHDGVARSGSVWNSTP